MTLINIQNFLLKFSYLVGQDKEIAIEKHYSFSTAMLVEMIYGK